MKKNRFILPIAFVVLALLPAALQASFDVNQPRPGTRNGARTADACLPATSSAELDINNVRALLHNGGDMWWDLVSNPRYEVPKVSNPANAKHSMFASSLWIGGFDGSGQLRIAAQTYRQSGNDFWPGPLRVDGTASVDDDICEQWDKHFRITKAEIDAFRAAYANFEGGGEAPDMNQYPNVRDWPAENPDFPVFDQYLAPFVDVNNDGSYDPLSGDYPDILGDQAIWWVINDKGDIHTSTQGEQIGVEIHMLAFAFATSNEINNMTFYRETVFNRSTNVLQDAYIAQWVDADLGFFADDYVGCDTIRGLGICYNGDNNDDPPNGYGSNPPAIGVDFFQGPFADPNDSTDNDKDGIIDEPEERISMAKFIYYNNDFSIRGNPTVPQHFYGYMAGFWRNGSAIVDDRGGNGNGFPDAGESFEPTNYMFPDYPGQCNASSCQFISYTATDPWDEVCAGNDPFDRRFVQSAGPFTLQAGAVNDIVVGVVWSRDLNAPDQLGSVCQLLQADDVAQALFDSGFDLLDGPDAPDVKIEEFDEELVVSWQYTNPTSNNFFENYRENDPVLEENPTVDATFEFEGYIVYQLLNDRVSAGDLGDPNLARPIAQCDIQNGVSTIVNRQVNTVPGVDEPIIQDQVMVEGADDGLFHTLRVTEDAFSDAADKSLVNYRDYYFAVVAYAYNDTSSDGRKFLIGNGNFQRIQAVPHKTQFENFGMNLSSEYGDGPTVRLVSGQGNGGRFVEITDQVENEILENNNAQVEYKPGTSPIDIKVVNPKEVQKKTYRVRILRNELIETQLVEEDGQVVDTLDVYADWELIEVDPNSGAQIASIYQSNYVVYRVDEDTLPTPLSGTERYIDGHGISVAVSNALPPGNITGNNGVIGARIDFTDPQRAWLTGLPDLDNVELYNWVRSAQSCTDGGTCPGTSSCNEGVCIGEVDEDFLEFSNDSTYVEYQVYDPNKDFQELLGGTWAPYGLAAHFHTQKDIVGPRLKVDPSDDNPVNSATTMSIQDIVSLPNLPNVDIVITSDPTKWSRCLVIETSPAKNLSSGAFPMAPRWENSLEQGEGCNLESTGGTLDPNGSRTGQSYGYSYFPGYAIDVDRGIRLNIMFGESSWHKSENGGDMLFNPTAEFGSDGRAVGGRHYIYVLDQPYDGCENLGQYRVKNANIENPQATTTGFIYNVDGETVRMDSIFKHVAWTSIPLLTDPQFAFDSYCDIPSDVRVQLRVNRSFANNPVTDEVPTYEFTLDNYASEFNQDETAENAVTDLINIVPNPYYGRSGTGRGSYEVAQLDQRVKITNLPFKCTIRIFTLNGQLVRIFRKESEAPNLEWDMRNDFGVPIASGLYIIHVDAEDYGEKILKFFCIMPELDLNAY